MSPVRSNALHATVGARVAAAVRFSPLSPALGIARRLARQLLLSAPARGLASPLLSRRRGYGACLLYHRVDVSGDAGAAWGNAGLSVRRDDFDLQMGWLARHHRCLAVGEAVTLLAERRLPPSTALVTFDDGYRDNLEHALPVLEKHGVPATVFIAPGLVDAAVDPWWHELETLLRVLESVEVASGRETWRLRLRGPAQRSRAFDRIAELGRTQPPAVLDRLLAAIRDQAARATLPVPRPAPPAANPMLTWAEIAELARHPLITIGAHTVSHPPLALLPPDQAASEIADSKTLLETRAGVPVEHFAYPFGERAQVGWRESDQASSAGFRSAFTALEGHLHEEHARHRFLLPRFPITRRDGLVGLRFKLSGWRALAQNRRERVVTL